VTVGDLTGHRVTRATVTIPSFGAWYADVEIDDEGVDVTAAPFASRLTIAGLALVGTLVRAASPYLGALAVRIIGGGAGWRKMVAPVAYQGDGGITLSLVAGDAARIVGERVVVLEDRAIGSAFVREACPASRVLNQLAASAWYVGADGTTVIGNRDATPIASPFVLVSHDGVFARYRIATEIPADWTPGRAFPTTGGMVMAGTVVHTLDGGTLRTDVLA